MKYAKENNIIGIQINDNEWNNKNKLLRYVEEKTKIKLDNKKWDYTYLKEKGMHLITQEF